MDREDDISRLSHLERRAVLRLRRRVDQLLREREEKGGVMRGDAWWDSRMEWEERERARCPASAAERERALREDNERLRGKCNRLIETLDVASEWDGTGILHDGDLTPEPHGAASEGEG